MRMVVKVGTSIVSGKNGELNPDIMNRLCETVCEIRDNGHEIILVSSGAVGLGAGKAGIKRYPEETPKKQALAAIGQCELMYMYGKRFGKSGRLAAQLLITRDITDNEVSRNNAINTINELINMGAVPIVNENDSVATDELEKIANQDKKGLKSSVFGDNDILSAVVAEMVQADSLVILTDIDGLYDKDPNKNSTAKKIHRVDNIDECIKKVSAGKGSEFSTGGMYSKLKAVSYAVKKGIICYISDGNMPEGIKTVAEGGDIGTVFLPK